MKSTPAAQAFNAQGMRIAVIAARWNDDVVAPMLECAESMLSKANVATHATFRVPGAYELPLAAKWLAQGGEFDGIVALGAVIRGETPHFEYVCNECARGLSDVQLEYDVPVGFGLVTANNDAQAMARAGGAVGNKGEEATLAVIEMIALRDALGVSLSGSA
ncbi:MAG: 6,7-dimethyl-8-ribityllumazine synthase [Gammaproteobacteria bacterium]